MTLVTPSQTGGAFDGPCSSFAEALVYAGRLSRHWDTEILPSLSLALIAYSIWIVLYWLEMKRAPQQRYCHFVFTDWTLRRYLGKIGVVLVANFAVSFLCGIERQKLYGVEDPACMTLGLVRGGYEGALWGLYSFMSFSVGVSILLVAIEVIGRHVARQRPPRSLTLPEKFLTGHTFACIAGAVVTPVGTVMWMVQDNLLIQATASDLYSILLPVLGLFWLSAVLLGFNVGALVGYAKHVASRTITVIDLHAAIRIGAVSLFLLALLLIAGLSYYVKAHPTTFPVRILLDPLTAPVLIVWFGYALLALAAALVSAAFTERLADRKFDLYMAHLRRTDALCW